MWYVRRYLRIVDMALVSSFSFILSILILSLFKNDLPHSPTDATIHAHFKSMCDQALWFLNLSIPAVLLPPLPPTPLLLPLARALLSLAPHLNGNSELWLPLPLSVHASVSNGRVYEQWAELKERTDFFHRSSSFLFLFLSSFRVASSSQSLPRSTAHPPRRLRHRRHRRHERHTGSRCSAFSVRVLAWRGDQGAADPDFSLPDQPGLSHCS